MKNLLLFITLLTASLTTLAQSALRVSLSDGSRFNISVNGRYFNRQGQSITVGDLPPGRQYIKLYRITQTRRGSTYDELIYQGTVRTNMGMTTLLRYDPYNRQADIQQQDLQPGRRQPMQPPMAQSYADDRNTNQPGNSNNNDYTDNTTPAQPLPPGTPAASPVAEGKTGSLTDEKMQQLKTRIDAKKTDTEKMNLLKESLKKEQLTTYDVSSIMDLFIFESSKADFAKWAYTITVDPELYTDLLTKLTTQSNKDDLNRFIKSRR